MDVQLRGKYNRQALTHAMNIFNFPNHFANNSTLRVKSISYLFRFGEKDRNAPKKEELKRRCVSLFRELRGKDTRNAAELADLYEREFGDNLLVEQLRTEDKNQVENKVQPVHNINSLKKVSTVYSDSQNSHNSRINKTVLHAAGTLHIRYREIFEADQDGILENIRGYLIRKYQEKKKLIQDTFEYFLESVFWAEIKNSTSSPPPILTLQSALASTWIFIQDHPNKSDLELRLLEEFSEMEGYCSTGHLSRLMSVIQGYTEDENLIIRISNMDQLRSVVKTFLTKKLTECRDERVVEGMAESEGENHLACVEYIRNAVAERLLEWKAEYGEENLEKIAEVVNAFLGKEVFEMEKK